MKKEDKIFLIIIIGWLFLLNFTILSIIQNSLQSYNGAIIKNLITGAVIYYPYSTKLLLLKVFTPLLVFNLIIIFLLYLSYYYWKKFKKNKTKTKSKK